MSASGPVLRKGWRQLPREYLAVRLPDHQLRLRDARDLPGLEIAVQPARDRAVQLLVSQEYPALRHEPTLVESRFRGSRLLAAAGEPQLPPLACIPLLFPVLAAGAALLLAL